MNLDAVGPGHESEYVITEYWIAAFGHLVVKPFQVLCVDYENIVGRFAAYPFVAGLLGRRLVCRFRSLDGLGFHFVMLQYE